jgi:outer membrane protein
MRNLTIAALVLFVSALSYGSIQKIGYVDADKALSLTKAGKTAKKNLEDTFKAKQKKLADYEKDLNKMKEDLEKKAMVLSDDVRASKQAELQKKFQEYQKLYMESQNSMQAKQREVMEPLYKKLREVIGEVAEKEKYAMILEKREQSVLWAAKDFDLTEKVVKAFEKKKKK